MTTWRLMFNSEEPVNRKNYFLWGGVLLGLFYGVETFFHFYFFDQHLSPLKFLIPLIQFRYPLMLEQSLTFSLLTLLWGLPFIWVGVSMTLRRAIDAGLSPRWSVIFFIPGFNYALILVLWFMPTRIQPYGTRTEDQEMQQGFLLPLKIALFFIAVGTLIVWLCSNYFKEYGGALFLGAPLLLGVPIGFFAGRAKTFSYKKMGALVAMTVAMVHLSLLFYGLEGAICLAFSFPLMVTFALLGGGLGAFFAAGFPAGMLIWIFLVPLWIWYASRPATTHRNVVLTTMEIHQPPQDVWRNVISFPPLPAANHPLFLLGVSYPTAARIEGKGVGAIRRCDFSTGSFIEPITAWERPYRLAFDVVDQPAPMVELSFHENVDAPHLNGYFRSVKGEFRLIPLEGGRTLLEGRTWYEMDMAPGWYWGFFTEKILHMIHGRVLGHIKRLSESNSVNT